MGRRCHFWIPNKRRFCANTTLPDSQFCGNHNPSSEEQRVPCPVDPSHSVLKGKLDSHVRKCPLRKQSQELEAQPFYEKGINGGGGEEDGHASSEAKRNDIYKLTVPGFLELIRRIKSVHSSLSSDLDLRESYLVPEACGVWLEKQGRGRGQGESRLPFQEKHAVQQASIIGNMEAFGILQKKPAEACGEATVEVPAVVEFGAGRGYLTQMLADCYEIQKLFLVERRSYKLKADRSLRQKQNMILERLRIDIEDLNLNAVGSLKGLPYLAIGKHLCGPAIDLTLRCCLPEQYNYKNCIRAKSNCYLRGLALATCCHHLCQWKHYINKKFLSNLGITKEDFHAITWLSSWAVDADHNSDLSNDVNQGQQPNPIETKDSDSGNEGIEETMRNMKAADRALLGFICKEIIDIGRLSWLKENGLDALLVKYVPANISPENHLLVAECSTHLCYPDPSH